MSRAIGRAMDRARFRIGRRPAAFLRADEGTTSIEMAFVAPVFFAIVIATLEVGIIVWFAALLNDGAQQAARHLRDETMKCVRSGTSTNNCTAATVAGLRSAACATIARGGMSCDAAKLKLAIYPADNPITTEIPANALINARSADLKSSRAYVIMLGYEWPFGLPTSKMLLFTKDDRSQLQARVYASTAERALR